MSSSGFERQDKETETELNLSKSAVKRQMLELKMLGEKIVRLPESQLKKIPLDEKLLDAIYNARKITRHGGLKRQQQYIGKLLRHVDPDPIKAALFEIEYGHTQTNRLFHLKEQWRDQLLRGGNNKLADFVDQYPSTDLQRLRQLLRNHKTAKTEDKEKQITRQIFKIISEQIIE